MQNSTELPRDTALAILDEAFASNADLDLLVIVSSEGDVIASRASDIPNPHTISISSYASLAICDGMATQADLGTVQCLTMRASRGMLVALKSVTGSPFALVAGARSKTPEATLINTARQCLDKLQFLL